MKRNVLLVALLLTIVLTGCSGNAEKTLNENSEPTENVSDEIKYADMIPVPEDIFKNGNITITDADGGKAYIFEVTGYNKEEYASYVSECKSMGFSDISYETENDFGAYTSDGAYWVQVNLDTSKEVIYVICQTSTQK